MRRGVEMSRWRGFVAVVLAALVMPVLTPPGARALPPRTPTLVDVRAAHHPGFDRIVFEFADGLPGSRRVGYVPRLMADGSGRRVRIPGRAILQVRFERADAHTDAGRPTAPRRVAFALPNVITTVRSGDFEAVTTYGIGLARKSSFHVFTLQRPARVVIDVRAAFPTVNRSVYFVDTGRVVANTPPFVVPRLRPVRRGTPAAGLLDRLFAGPLLAEQTQGLRLVRSRATGFTDLSVSGRVARVRLTGRCTSGGSTVTVADEIMPTLRALRGVRWVKIFDRAGHTAAPNGKSDSVPACLEP